MNPSILTGGGVARGPAPEVAGGGLPRVAVIVSIVLHVLAFVFVVGLPRLLSSGPSGNKVYVVDLVGLPGNPAPAAPATPAAAAPAPAPEPPKPAPVKPPETPKAEVKKEPPKKAPPKPVVVPDKDVPKKKTPVPEKVPEKKTPEPEPKAVEPPAKPAKDDAGDGDGEEETAAAAPATTPATTPPATTKPGAAPAGEPGGTGTGGSGGSGTGGGDELDFYLSLLKRRIEAAWKRPVSTSRETRSAVVFVELSSTGRLLRLELKTPSGYAPFDRSIIQAVKDAEPFPAFPLALKMDRLARSIEFQLTPLEGGAPQ